MAQRTVEAVIGRLATDEAFRAAFARDPRGVLEQLVHQDGLGLTPVERDALAATDTRLWDHVAAALDPRLQRVALSPEDWAR